MLSGGDVVGDMPVEALVDDCPLYDLAPEKPSAPIYPAPRRALLDADATPPRACPRCCAPPTSPPPAGVRAVRLPRAVAHRAPPRRGRRGRAAAARRRRRPAIAVSIDGSGRRVACDPYRGTVEAVLECAANLACVGAEPLGLTNCLNFGNPEKPHIAWQLTESVRGLADACRALDVPVVGGNVSLYNEGADGPDLPDAGRRHGRPPARRRARRPARLRREGDAIAFAGPFTPSLAGSELAKLRGEPLPDGLPEVDVAAVRAAQEAVRDAVRARRARAARTTSPRAASRSRSPSAAWPAGTARRSTLRRRREGERCWRRCSARAPAASSLSGPRPALAALAREIR